MTLDLTTLTYMTKRMCQIRSTEEKLLELFSQGKLNGTVHTCIGQEACAVGVVQALDCDKDILYSNHRGHGHFLSYCGDVRGLIAEVMGLPEGVCGGVGGSQHLQRNNFYSNGIQGAGVPIVAGMALAQKLSKKDVVSVAFIGDGTFGEGVLYETLNIASLWKLPMLIVVEHNQYAQSTSSKDEHSGNIEDRPKGFAYPVTVANGMDLIDVYTATSHLVAQIRKTGTPQMLVLHTYRFAPHSKGDDFRDPSEVAQYRRMDPIEQVKERLGEEVVNGLRAETAGQVEEIVRDLTNV